uniref:GDSL esterase/lipase n=1 Tax=Aegilops tauschii TaxID=37682 RepID=N1R2Q5_AEGTA
MASSASLLLLFVVAASHVCCSHGQGGFDEDSTHKACCGAGGKYNYDVRRACGVEGAAVCADPSAYVSWDGIHMTQAAYKAMSRLIYHGRYLQPQILSFREKNGQT